MERDTVLEAWASLEAQLKRTERLNDLIVVEALSRKAQTPLTRERRLVVFEIAVNFIALVALASFTYDHAGNAAGISAAVLALTLIAIDGVLISIAFALWHIDFESPVVTLQAELARIKTRRAALTGVILIAGPLLWTPIFIVALGIFGIDAVHALGIPYIAANVALGLLVAAGAWLTVRFFGDRLRRSPRTARLVDVLSGQAYREAADYLDTIERYCEG